MKIFINNRYYSKRNAKVSIFDHGYLYGDGIYETMRSNNGVVFKIDEHITRLFRSAKMIYLDIRYSKQEIKSAVYRTLKINKLKNAYIRISFSRGIGEIGLDTALCKKPVFVIITNKFRQYPKEYYKNGVKIIIAETRRNHPKSLNPKIKSNNFLNNILAKIEAKKRNAFESIMLNLDGFIAEGTVSNIFIVKNGILMTPSLKCGILGGITRKYILESAKKMKIKVKEAKIRINELYAVDECFITNTSIGIMPVRSIDGRRINVKGEVIKRLIKLKFN
ncbi:MAG: hypothetical protein A2474_02895 [Elusimicrobia bacterium RIFOXYC2_FULL_34_12]|nr:MAG: hypothetical protein A2474_02895 [Elusimicrobia bacterium RIFOXYC2_FULL_34_12]OGS39639.1 MAG: hypothetical protein A2551_03640 [Elusimicrobia bacterium RIFOXYD2_FULL_34_30]HAM37788.1 branched-chain amino acid aminotransferase [Elusimicrobiota bacterium]